MTHRAMSFSGVIKSNSPAGIQHMFFVGNKNKVERIAAGRIFARVVKDRGFVSPSLIWKRSDQPRIHKPMTVCHISHVSNVSITKTITCAIPDPTFTKRVDVINLDLRENSFNCFARQGKGLCEILASSHSLSPFQTSFRLETVRVAPRSVLFCFPIIPRSIEYLCCANRKFSPVPDWEGEK